MIKKTIIIALTTSSIAVTAFAHGGATDIVKTRMDAMMAMGKSVKAVAPMMRRETPYDAAAVKSAAQVFAIHSGEAMTELFPEGSGGGASDATPEVWTEWEKFEALAAQLGTYANGLALAADNGLSDARKAHASERGVSDSLVDGVIVNGGDEEDLVRQLDSQWFTDLLEGRSQCDELSPR